MHPFLSTTLWICFLFYLICNVDLRETEFGKGKSRGRIKGGEETSIDQFPWTVSLRGNIDYNGDIQCGGSIIDSKWVLTAAHCIYDERKPWWVTAGTNEGKSPSYDDRYYIRRYHPHPTYRKVIAVDGNLASKRDDIALLELGTELRMLSGSIQPIRLSQSDVRADQQCQVVGWGDTDGLRHFPSKLMKINVRFGSCDHLNFLVNPNDNICTQSSTQQACLGDSGGPLMCKEENGLYFLKGVLNSGTACHPTIDQGEAVFAKVANYVQWIKQVTGLDLRSLTQYGPGTNGRMYNEIANAESGIENGGNASNISNLPAISEENLARPRPDELNELDGSYKLDGGDDVQPEPRRPDVPDDSKKTIRLDKYDGAPTSTTSASMPLTTSKIFLFIGVPIFIIVLIVVLVVAIVLIRKSSHPKKGCLEMTAHLPEPGTK